MQVTEETLKQSSTSVSHFPTFGGIFLGLGLGGFFEGIVLHQILQWHHMATSVGHPSDSLENLKFNALLDGLFHAATYVLVLIGLVILWRATHRQQHRWSGRMLAGSLLMGFGLFNLVEGLVDHHILKLHHVNETAPREQWIYWDADFLAWGSSMLFFGWRLLVTGKHLSKKEPEQSKIRLSQLTTKEH